MSQSAHRRPRGVEALRDRVADPLRAPGDDGDLPVQSYRFIPVPYPSAAITASVFVTSATFCMA
jgi:hypothetical protein